jgi:hypothetical protein
MNIKRLIAHTIGLALTVGTMTMATAATAHADEPAYTTAWFSSIGSGYGNAGDGKPVFLKIHVQDAEADTTATLDIFGCNGALIGSTTKVGQGEFDVVTELWEVAKGRVGPSLQLRATFNAPGKVASSQTRTWDNAGGACSSTSSTPASNKSIPRSWVKKYPKVTIAKKAGKTAKMSTVKLSTSGKKAHVKVSYRWVLNGKVVGTKKAIHTKKAWKHKKLTAQIVMKKSGYNTRIATLKTKRIK